MKLVQVHWDDAWSSAGWGASKDNKGVPVVSVGFLHEKNAAGVSLVSRQASDGAVGHQMFIPTGMIRKIKTIKVKI